MINEKVPNYFNIFSLRFITAELPIASPLVYASLRMTEIWKDSVMESLLNYGQAPESFIPGCFVDPSATGPAITKYRGLFEPQNTPFKVRTI